MKCENCGGKLVKSIRAHHYIESGLKNVFLANIPIYDCTECSAREIVIPNLNELHQLIAKQLATQRQRLYPEEIRFLRAHLGYSKADYAKRAGVTLKSVTRWETGTANVSMIAERFLRLLVLDMKIPFREYDVEKLDEFGRDIAPQKPKKLRYKIDKKSQWLIAA